MSGITAVFHKHGSVSRSEFEQVFHTLDHRGHDGADDVVFDRVALGHQHNYTTPEAVGEQQPISLDDAWLAFDGRIDNRQELLDQLPSVDPEADAGRSDAELVLRAYRDLGEGFLEELVGAFVFALWDESAERLLLARDKTGIRKLYYADAGDVVVAASETRALLQHPAVPDDRNDGLIGELLVERFITQDQTFYEAVLPVPRGSRVDVTAEETSVESYWEVWDAAAEIDPPDDPVEEFRDLMEQAVASRLRSTALPGIMLSGGLDSTTIACLARRLIDRGDVDDDGDDLHGFSFIIDDVDYFEDEIERLDAVVDAADVESHRIHGTDHYTLKDVELYEELSSETPVAGALSSPTEVLHRQAAETGRDVLLMGAGGNMYDGNRFFYLDLLRSGHPLRFLRDARADPWDVWRIVLWFILVPHSDRLAEFLKDYYDVQVGSELPEWIDDEFAERVGLQERADASLETGFDSEARRLSYRQVFGSDREFEDAIERLIALRSGVDLRFPFFDSRLVAYLFAVPTWELHGPQEDKLLFRESMKGILPEIVRTQHASVHFGPIVNKGIQEERTDYVRDLFEGSKLAELGVVDEDAFRAHMNQFIEEDEPFTRGVWELISMEMWLRHSPVDAEP